MLYKYDHDQPVNSAEEFQQALRHCCQAKNKLSRVKGYTPEILVLGKRRPLPGSVCGDHPTAAQYLADSETPEGIQFRQQLLNVSVPERLMLKLRQRPARGFHTGGTYVVFWRPGKGEQPGHWHGPAKVIIQESTHVVWISH